MNSDFQTNNDGSKDNVSATKGQKKERSTVSFNVKDNMLNGKKVASAAQSASIKKSKTADLTKKPQSCTGGTGNRRSSEHETNKGKTSGQRIDKRKSAWQRIDKQKSSGQRIDKRKSSGQGMHKPKSSGQGMHKRKSSEAEKQKQDTTHLQVTGSTPLRPSSRSRSQVADRIKQQMSQDVNDILARTNPFEQITSTSNMGKSTKIEVDGQKDGKTKTHVPSGEERIYCWQTNKFILLLLISIALVIAIAIIVIFVLATK